MAFSKDGVKYKINRLIEKGIIKGFFFNLGFTTMGYINYIVYLRLRNTDDKKISKIVDSLIKKKYVVYCSSCTGKWDISLQLLSRSILTFEKYLDEVIELIGSQLSDYETFISFKEYKVYDNILDEFFKEVKIDYSPSYRKKFNRIRLDDLDKKILYLLAENARMPLSIIAEKTGKSIDTIQYRKKVLERNGYMYSYGISLDNAKLDYSMDVLFLQMYNMTPTREDDLSRFFQNHPNIRWAHKAIGKQIILVETLTNSKKSLQHIITELKNKFSDVLVSYDSISEYENFKDITIPNLDEMD